VPSGKITFSLRNGRWLRLLAYVSGWVNREPLLRREDCGAAASRPLSPTQSRSFISWDAKVRADRTNTSQVLKSFDPLFRASVIELPALSLGSRVRHQRAQCLPLDNGQLPRARHMDSDTLSARSFSALYHFRQNRFDNQ